MGLVTNKLKVEVENVLRAMQDVRGRRPTTRLEFFMWLGEFDDASRRFAERLEKELGVKSFEQWLLGFEENDSKSIH